MYRQSLVKLSSVNFPYVEFYHENNHISITREGCSQNKYYLINV